MIDDMDINCGDILDGVPVAEGRGDFQKVLDVASATKSEDLGYGDAEFVPWQIGAVMSPRSRAHASHRSRRIRAGCFAAVDALRASAACRRVALFRRGRVAIAADPNVRCQTYLDAVPSRRLF